MFPHNSKILPGNWLEKEKQEIRSEVEQRRKEPGEEIRDTEMKGHTETHLHTHMCTLVQRGSEVGRGGSRRD